MAEKELVITHLRIIHTWSEFARERDLQFFTKKHLEDITQWTTDALAMLKEQKALLNKAYELLADMGLDFFCEDLICNDGWCDDHCTTNGTTPECIERWLRKQIEEG